MKPKLSPRGVRLAESTLLSIQQVRAMRSQNSFWPHWNGSEPHPGETAVESLSDCEAHQRCVTPLSARRVERTDENAPLSPANERTHADA